MDGYRTEAQLLSYKPMKNLDDLYIVNPVAKCNIVIDRGRF